jgi:hypothetical protein
MARATRAMATVTNRAKATRVIAMATKRAIATAVRLIAMAIKMVEQRQKEE